MNEPRGGIFCIESDWDADLRSKRSVLPVLELMQRLEVAPAIHRSAPTRDAVTYYLGRWAQPEYDDHPVLYLATHGSHDELVLADDESFTLDEVADVLEDRCGGRIVYFAGCGILDSEAAELKKFVKRLGARAVVGYVEDVDWLLSAAFEIHLLTELVEGGQPAGIYRRLAAGHPNTVEQLGLVIATGSSVYGAAAE